MGSVIESLANFLFSGTSVGTYEIMAAHVADVAKIRPDEVGFIVAVYNAILPAAYGFLIAFSLYTLLDKIIEHGETITLYTIIPIFIRIAICIALFSASDVLIGALAKVSNLLYQETYDAISAALKPDMVFDYQSLASGWSFLGTVYILAWSGFIGFFARIGAIIMITVSAMVTKAEFVIRAGFLPIAIANICSYEHRGGIRYIKQTIANAFFMLVIIAEIFVTGLIFTNLIVATNVLEGFWGYCVNFFLITLCGPHAACLAVMASKNAIYRALE